MKNISGFTLVEMVIVIVIIGILSMIAVPIYRGHVAHSISIEGRALVSEVAAAQEIYMARARNWYRVSNNDDFSGNIVADLGLDSRRNQYFREFSWNVTGSTPIAFTVTAVGESSTRAAGVTVELTYYSDQPAVINEIL